MKKTLSIEPIVSTYISEVPGMGYVHDIVGEEEYEDDEKVTIHRIGCRINKSEPTEVYAMYHLFHAMKPGWKGDYQDGFSWDYFLTCSCGHAGCNGYWDGIRIHRKKETVRVFGQKAMGYDDGVVGTGADVVYFDKSEWDGVLEYYLDLFRANPLGIFQDNDFIFTGRYGLKKFG